MLNQVHRKKIAGQTTQEQEKQDELRLTDRSGGDTQIYGVSPPDFTCG